MIPQQSDPDQFNKIHEKKHFAIEPVKIWLGIYR